jgi:hypothetical protein
MGFETFRVELRGGKANYAQADEAIQELPHIRPDQHSLSTRGSRFYLYEDGQHAIELAVLDASVRVSCRFTLCHPPSVDAVFLGLVRDLMARLGMEAKICDDVLPDDARSFALDDFAAFAAATRRYITARRAEWIGAFGDVPMAATTNEVYQRIILPRCQPGIKQPT